MSKVYFNQQDSRWINYPYTSSNHPNATVGSSGCGPTSGSMVISSFKETVYPNQMAQIFKDNGYRVAEGTSLSAFPFIAKKYGLICNYTNNIQEAVNCLKRDGMVVASCLAGGLFSTGGHLIALAGMKDANTIIIYDPYLYNGKFNNYGRQGKVTVEGNNVYCSISNFQNYAKCQGFYCYEKPEEDGILCNAHVQDIGWMGYKNCKDNTIIGTTGQKKRLEAVQFKTTGNIDLEYRVHIQDIGWQEWKKPEEIAGTTGRKLRIEAIEFKCNKTLEVVEHLQDIGWMPKSKGTEIRIGTTGKKLRLEAFKINIIG